MTVNWKLLSESQPNRGQRVLIADPLAKEPSFVYFVGNPLGFEMWYAGVMKYRLEQSEVEYWMPEPEMPGAIAQQTLEADREPIQLLDVVELLVDIPCDNAKAGDVGTVVEILADGAAFEVEIADEHGRTRTFASPDAHQVRKHKPF